MKSINTLLSIAIIACLPLAAAEDHSEATTMRHPTEDPQDPGPATPRHPLPQGADGCAASGCPQADQHGHPPVSCEYKSGMSTGFRCILFCTYTDSQWGTLVDSSRCN